MDSPPGIIIPGAIIKAGSAIEELKPGSGGSERGVGRPVEEARLQLSAPEVTEVNDCHDNRGHASGDTRHFRDCAAQNREVLGEHKTESKFYHQCDNT